MAEGLAKLKAVLDRTSRLLVRLKNKVATFEATENGDDRYAKYKSEYDRGTELLRDYDQAVTEFEVKVEQQYAGGDVPDEVSNRCLELQDKQDVFHDLLADVNAEMIRLRIDDGRRRYLEQVNLLDQRVYAESVPGRVTPPRNDTTVPRAHSEVQGRRSAEPDHKWFANAAGSGLHRPGPVPRTARPPSPSASIHTAFSHVSQAAQRPVVSTVKLPKLVIPSFTGEAGKFKPFWCRFDNAVGANPYLTDSDKLSYLVMFLEGNPKAMVEGLNPTNENYAVAVKILHDTYGNENVAVEQIEAKLAAMEIPRNTGESLRKFYCELERHIGSLRGLGRAVTSPHLVSTVLSKLPLIVTSNMERVKTTSVEWTVELVQNLLRTEVEIMEALDRRNPRKEKELVKNQVKVAFGSTTEAMSSNERRYERPTHERTRTANPNQWNQPVAQARTCIFCNSTGHFSEDCGVVRSNHERLKKLQDMGRCTVCLKPNHRKQNCWSEKPCYHCKKVKDHNRAICYNRRSWTDRRNPIEFRSSGRSRENAHLAEESCDRNRNRSPTSAEDRGEERSFQRIGSSDIVNLADDEQTILKTALVKVGDSDGRNKEEVRLFLDSGCSRSYITEKLAKRLGLKLESSRMLTVNRFGGGDGGKHTMEVKTAQITLSTVYGRRYRIKVAVVKDIMNRMTKFALKRDVLDKIPKRYILADQLFTQSREVEIEFLVGNDYYDDFITGRRIDLGSGFRLMDSEFGWILSGRIQDGQRSMHEIVALFAQEIAQVNVSDEMVVEPARDDGKTSSVEDMWSLESLGITDDPNPVSDDAALETFNRTIKFEDNRYQVTWPWRANASELPSNYAVAKRRLETTVNRIKRTPGLIERYDGVIQDQLKKSVIEETLEETPHRVHYLPHREVLTPDKETTKLRIVYDASARAAPDKPSLNDCLHRGQVFMTALLCLLMRFMLAPVMVISDIEKAFLQVGLQEHERDVTRFLWLRDITGPITKANLVIYRFMRVAFGMSPSPFLLGATIVHHLRKSPLEVARLIEDNSYVDNIITGFRTAAEAIQFYFQSKALFREASMNLREFASNSQEFMRSIPDVDRVAKTQLKVLGIGWDLDKDEIYLNVPKTFPVATTKRHVLQGLLKVYDPLGFVCPVIIRSRILMQKLCQGSGKKWNVPLSEDEIGQYRNIVAEYEKFRNHKWPRYFGHGIADEDRLMCFCDASQNAYATVVYLQHPESAGCFSSRILFAKARVSPVKTKMTIPRLELMALLIGVRAIKFVREQLSFTGRVLVWSDSQCVLKWIASNRVYGTFVENRLKEIRRVPNLEYRYVPTKENPADLPSRGVSYEELDQFWWQGPSWSLRNEDFWPKVEVELRASAVAEQQAEELETKTEDVALAVVPAAESPFGIESQKYSSYGTLLRVTAYCVRFLAKARNKPIPKRTAVSLEELRQVEKLWMLYLQRIGFADLLRALTKGNSHPTQNQLGTKFDKDGIIRCQGRMGELRAPTDRKFPILLPKAHHVTRLIVEHVHKICLHGGKKVTLNTLHRKYWIIRGASAVSSVLRKCTRCQTVDGIGFARPEMPDLPWYRVNRSYPFEYTGIDYFGPLFVRGELKCVGSSTENKKVWICLATCLATTAVHLELVGSLSANDFLLALRRFVARRGKPTQIMCDNGSQFVHVAKNDLLSQSFEGEPIEWNFITPFSPWKGGAYERIVGLVKSALKRSIGRCLLTKDQLATLMTEIEYTLNSRPLTTAADDVGLGLTPNDLLGLRNLGDIDGQPSRKETDPSYAQKTRDPSVSLKEMFRKTRSILDQFWHVWRTEYVDALRESHRQAHHDPRRSVRRQPRPGEVVHVMDAKLPRNRWKLGIIRDVTKSQDGSVREVQVDVGKGTILTRPLNLISPLELAGESTTGQKQAPTTTTGATTTTTTTEATTTTTTTATRESTANEVTTARKILPASTTSSTVSTNSTTNPSLQVTRPTRQAATQAKGRIKTIFESDY